MESFIIINIRKSITSEVSYTSYADTLNLNLFLAFSSSQRNGILVLEFHMEWWLLQKKIGQSFLEQDL